MSYPDSATELTELVSVMRRLGVIQAFGVVLGPPVPEERDSKPETPEAKRLARQEARRDELRGVLAASGEYTNAQLDEMLGPDPEDHG